MNNRFLLAVLSLGLAGNAFAGGGGMSKDAYQAAQARVEATQKSEVQACDGAKGHARDICRTAAKGRGKVALAELVADYQPSPAADRAVMMAQADADYDLARQHCDEAQGPAKDACRARADHVREAAVRLAKIERVEATRRLKAKGSNGGPVAVQQSPDEKYAAEKARCGMLGEERDNCLIEAKRRFHRG
ncbi:MAG: hypothetical protein JWQ76_4417 [Ramlibacter sp.]|nr:hypothetical protein [Ramlibacter sp.]